MAESFVVVVRDHGGDVRDLLAGTDWMINCSGQLNCELSLLVLSLNSREGEEDGGTEMLAIVDCSGSEVHGEENHMG